MLGEILRYETVLPPILSELAILATARRWNSELNGPSTPASRARLRCPNR